MICHMKSGVTLIVAVFLWGFPFGWAQAANLISARAGEHENFTRVSFEFQDIVRSKGPIITGRGKFYVTFLDSTTSLPHRTLSRTTKWVQSIELIQEASHLTANITLSFPYFRLKTFSLQNPDRFVIDAYRMSSPSKEVVPKKSAHPEPIASVSERPSQKDQMTDTEKDSEKASQAPEKRDKPLLSGNRNHNIQTYLLALLNFLAVIIIALISFNLLKRRSGPHPRHPIKVLNSIETTDESISDVDALIKKEMAKIDQF
jgi:hypothetical protein